MKILITGAKGFIGKNLSAELKNQGYTDILEYDIDSDPGTLDEYTQQCEFVYHLAGINRPKENNEFMEGNFGFTETLLNCLRKHGNHSPILITSSIQAELDNPYGKSKKAVENLMFSYGKESGGRVLIYRLPNVFGKWCRPNYNSAVATFCNNIAYGLPIQVNDTNISLNLVYIDDVVKAFVNALVSKENIKDGFCYVEPTHAVKLGEIVNLLNSFKASRENRNIPNMSNDFTKKLYSTYISYLPKNEFSYPLKMNRDHRGSFTEFIRTADRGQISINISKPGITKGNHWHHTKNEKFSVVSGKGLIKLRKIDSGEIIEYKVSADHLEVVDIPTGYTHNIINTGDTDMVTIMWVNEAFDTEKPDTYYLEV